MSNVSANFRSIYAFLVSLRAAAAFMRCCPHAQGSVQRSACIGVAQGFASHKPLRSGTARCLVPQPNHTKFHSCDHRHRVGGLQFCGRLVAHSTANGIGKADEADLNIEAMRQGNAAVLNDPERPKYHLMSQTGWLNDPNGPFFHNDRYHLFYQHITDACEWDFGIVWGHAVSTDLVHWQHLPPAIVPSPGGPDADGCFSGCCVIDSDGTPVILYTGVRLRSNTACGPLPPADQDLNLPFVECQLSAKPASGDKNLVTWHKSAEPLIAMPPPSIPLVGWRDPFIFEVGDGSEGSRWGMLMGSGLKGRGGSIMIYRSDSLLGDWQYDGMLCGAESIAAGAMWECPLLLELQSIPNHARPKGLGPHGDNNLCHPNKIYKSHIQQMNMEDNDSSDDEDYNSSVTASSDGDSESSQQPHDQLPQQQQDQGQTIPISEDFQHVESSDPAAVAGHPQDGTSASINGSVSQKEPQMPPSESSNNSAAVGQPSAVPSRHISPNLAKASALALAKLSAGHPTIINAGLPDDYRRSPTQSRVTEPQRPLCAPSIDQHLSRQMDDMRLTPPEHPPEPKPLRITHFLCVSPDAPTNPSLYWLGLFDSESTEFMLNESIGPIRLDLGEVLYAPNIQTDAAGRHIMWGWLQERRKPGSYDYSGCMTVPRLLYLEDERLIQVPIPEITRLRTGRTWSASHITVDCHSEVWLPGHTSPAMDLHLELRGCGAKSAGLLFHSFNVSEGNSAILFDFDQNILQAVFEQSGTELATSSDISPDDGTLRFVGGQTQLEQGCNVHLRVLQDHSCLEVFAGTGEVLSTRIYRGDLPEGADNISFVSFGGPAVVQHVEYHEMGSIWRDDIDAPLDELRESTIHENLTAQMAPSPAEAPQPASLVTFPVSGVSVNS